MLEAASIVAEAEARVGLTDSEPVIRANLDRLVDSLNATPGFRHVVKPARRKCWSIELRIASRALKWLRDFPEIDAEVIQQPVFLTGLPRSGTTFFQYLFDRDTRFRLIRTWEGISPSPPPVTTQNPSAAAKPRKANAGDKHVRKSPASKPCI